MDEKMLAVYFPASYENVDVMELENLIHNVEA